MPILPFSPSVSPQEIAAPRTVLRIQTFEVPSDIRFDAGRTPGIREKNGIVRAIFHARFPLPADLIRQAKAGKVIVYDSYSLPLVHEKLAQLQMFQRTGRLQHYQSLTIRPEFFPSGLVVLGLRVESVTNLGHRLDDEFDTDFPFSLSAGQKPHPRTGNTAYLMIPRKQNPRRSLLIFITSKHP